MPIAIKFEGDEIADRLIADKGIGLNQVLAPEMKKIALFVEGEARHRAPISPTKTQYQQTLQDFTTTRDDFNPGGLERAIQSESDHNSASVFIAANAEAGTYAQKIHDGKGKTWLWRGPGTRAKGNQADHKFILRAIKKNAKPIEDFIVQAVDRFLIKFSKDG